MQCVVFELLTDLTYFCSCLVLFALKKNALATFLFMIQRSTSRELNLKKLGPYVKIPIFYNGSALSEVSVTNVVSISKIAVNHNFYLILTVSI